MLVGATAAPTHRADNATTVNSTRFSEQMDTESATPIPADRNAEDRLEILSSN